MTDQLSQLARLKSWQRQQRLRGKAVIVTGAAEGIGRAVLLNCLAEGARVIAVDRNETALTSIDAEAGLFDSQCDYLVGDIADPRTVEAMIDRCLTAYGQLDGLINNAAISGPITGFQKTTEDDFEDLVSINVKPVWRSMQQAREPMAQLETASIVNIASMAALRASPKVSLYGMTKAAVANLTMNAALEYAKDNIRVNAVCPGPISTRMLGKMEQHLNQDDVLKARDQIATTIPLGRLGSVWEVANAATFLLSDEAAFMTGVLLPVDGGLSIKQ